MPSVAASSRTTRVRPATLADAVSLTRLEQRAFTGYYAAHRFSEAQFRYYLARPTTIVHVVERAATIVAYSLGVQNTASRRHLVRLHSIAVGAAERDRHLGGRLLNAFLTEARRRRCRRAYLEVAADNRPALALFARHGFTATARLRGFYSRSVDGVRMRCDLARARSGSKSGRRVARRSVLGTAAKKKLEVVRAATHHAFPTGDVQQMLREIERGYIDEKP